MGKIHELKPRLFDAGEVNITVEAFQRLKEGGVEPQQLLERHTRGDWSGAPVQWIEKNDLRFRGARDYPVMSVYQIHPSENRVCVATECDFSATSITNWPDGNHKAPLLPLKAVEKGFQTPAKALVVRGSAARELMDKIGRPTKEQGTPTPRRNDRDISR